MTKLLKRGWLAFFRLENRLTELMKKPWVRRTVFVLGIVMLAITVAAPAWAQAAADQPKSKTWTDTIAGGIASWITDFNQFIAKFVFGNIIEYLMTVMAFNKFSNSEIVSIGWSLVRDTVNLFYVIVLIYIAMATIFGFTSKFKWQQAVPRVLLFAIIINFSKTLCSLMIDLSQVVMLTFVNALKGFTVGNFTTLLGVQQMFKFSTATTDPASGTVMSGPVLLFTSLTGLIVLAVVTLTLGILLVIMLYRIILLWVLIILSPLAFFMGGVKSVFGSNMYDKWWGKFKCAILIGPVLSFFLWLTLAVGGSGKQAMMSGFSSAASSANAGGMFLSIFEQGNFISLLLGLGMLFAGFEAASEVCAGEGIVGGLLKSAQGYAKSGVKWAAGGAAALAIMKTRGAAQAASDIGAGAGRIVGRVGSSAVQALPGGKYIPLTKAGRAGAAGAVAGYLASKGYGRLAGAASSYAQATQQKVTADFKGAAGTLGKASTADQVAYLSAMAAKGGPGVMDKRKTMDLMANMLTDPKKREALEKSGMLDKLYTASTGKGRTLGQDIRETFKGDKDLKAGLDSFAKSRPDLTGEISNIDNVEDVRSLSAAALANKEVQKRLSELKAPERSGAKDMLDYVRKGRMGDAKMKAANLGQLGILQSLRPDELARQDVQAVAAALNEAPDPSSAAQLLSRNPEVAVNLLANEEVAATLQAKPEVLAAALASGAGVSGGQVTDQDKFNRMMRANAKAMQHLDFKDNDNLKKATLGALGGAAVGSMIASIKSNPAGNAGLRSKLEELSSYAHQPGTEVSDQTLKDLDNFHTQMGALDQSAAKREGKAAMAEQKASDKAAAAAPGLAMGELEAARKEVKDAEAALAKINQQIKTNRTKAEAALEAGKGNKYIAKSAQEQKLLQEQAAAQEKLQAAQTREQTASAAQRPFEIQQIQNQIAALRAERESFANIAEKTLGEAEKLAEIEASLEAKYARQAELEQKT